MGSESLRKGKSPFVEQHSCSCSYWRSFVIAREENKMTYNTMLARSFSWHEQRKLGSWAFVGSLVIAVTIFTVFKPYMSSNPPVLNLHLQLSTGASLNMLMRSKEAAVEPRQSYFDTKEVKPMCNLTRPRSDFCEMNGDIRIHGNSSKIFIASTPTQMPVGKEIWNIKPYARKEDGIAMGRVRRITIQPAQVLGGLPDCSRNYNIPAVVFSTGGYAGNAFHDFSDVLIPLYLTSIEFNGEVQFLITDHHSWWTDKYQPLLQKLSKYDFIDIDQESRVLCFPRVIVGLKATNKELGIDSSESSYSMMGFRQILRSAYSLKRERVEKFRNDKKLGKRPRLLVISRSQTRRLINTRQIAKMARTIGFNVVIKETGSNVSLVSEMVNSVDVMVGVHGAGLTNMVFLPEKAVVIQIIPLGDMEWIARTFYQEPERDMNLRYLEYKISPNESSLIQQYPHDHEIFKDPGAISKIGWRSFRSVFLDKQDVDLDLNRFKEVLLRALEFLHG
nr:uncharacterized protein LOC113742492 [Coffea arabica]